MFEIILYVLVVGLMVQVALHENKSPFVWGSISAGICLATVPIPLPFLRVLIAAVASVAAMMVYRLLAGE